MLKAQINDILIRIFIRNGIFKCVKTISEKKYK